MTDQPFDQWCRFQIVDVIVDRVTPTSFQVYFDAMRRACDLYDVYEICRIAELMREDEPLLFAVHRWLTSEQKQTWKTLIWNHRQELYPDVD